MSQKRGTVLALLELGKSRSSHAETADMRGRTGQDSKLDVSASSKPIILPSLAMAGRNVSKSQTTIRSGKESPVKFW